MERHISIRPAGGTWVVRAGGAVLGESDRALCLVEDGAAPVIYFPREDMAMAFLEESPKRSTCPHKGEARYFSIVTKSRKLVDAAWSYETPRRDMAEIAGHLAFDISEDVAVEEV